MRPILPLLITAVACGPEVEQAPVPVVRADPPVVVAVDDVATAELFNLGEHAVTLDELTEADELIFPAEGALGTAIPAGGSAQIQLAIEPASAGLAELVLVSEGLGLPPASRGADVEPAPTFASVIVANIPDVDVAEAPAILVEQVDTFATVDSPPRAAVFVWGGAGLQCFRVRGSNETDIDLTVLPSPTGEAAWGAVSLPDEAVAEPVFIRCEDGEGDSSTTSTAVTTQGLPYLADRLE